MNEDAIRQLRLLIAGEQQSAEATNNLARWAEPELRRIAEQELRDGVDVLYRPSDIVQEAFMRRFRDWLRGAEAARCQTDTDLQRYLNTCMRNFCRENRRVAERVEGGTEGTILIDPADSTADHDARRRRTEQIERAITAADRLEISEERQVFLLRAWTDLSHHEIGRILSISEEGSATHLSRAKKKLRKMME